MTLEEFITNYVARNSQVRIWRDTDEGTIAISDIMMEWEIIRSSIYSRLEFDKVVDFTVETMSEQCINLMVKGEEAEKVGIEDGKQICRVLRIALSKSKKDCCESF